MARLAEASYQQLSEPERQVAMTIFLRLVARGEGDTAVRRRVPVAEFDIDEDPTVAAVLAGLTRDRLLIRDDGLVEIAHEALIREWPRLSSWLKDDAVGRELRSHLTQAARHWAEHDRDAGDLYRGARLSAALDWSQSHGQPSICSSESSSRRAERPANKNWADNGGRTAGYGPSSQERRCFSSWP